MMESDDADERVVVMKEDDVKVGESGAEALTNILIGRFCSRSILSGTEIHSNTDGLLFCFERNGSIKARAVSQRRCSGT
jgi:hypothetical protein